MSKRSIPFLSWAVLSAAISGLVALCALLLHRGSLFSSFQVSASEVQPSLSPPVVPEVPLPSPEPELGPRHQLTYQQWVALLGREAKVAAEKHPARLHILAGDSISLWFPPELLLPNKTWLNQGISGETSDKLLRRLSLFDATQPETVFVMIGINDLLKGYQDETILANQQEIIQHLKTAHPRSRIVIQSILPHAGDRLTQKRSHSQPSPLVNRLAAVSNQRIQNLNQQLATMAKGEGVEYLDLYPYFADAQGDLLPELTTDGLHLSRQGYEVWRDRLQVLSQFDPS